MSTALVSQELLDLDQSEVSLEPDYAFLSTFSSFYVLGALGSSLAETSADFIARLPDITGSVLVEDGILTSDLDLPEGSFLEGEFNLPATLNELAGLATSTSGSAGLVDGIFTAEISSDEGEALVDSFDLANFASTFVLGIVNGIDTVVTLEDGAFSFAETTPLGDFNGILDIGGGDLNFSLESPFGDFAFDTPFGEEAVFPIGLPAGFEGLEALVDLNAGNIVVSLGALGEAVLAIDELDGQIALADGLATFSTDLPIFGTVEADFEVGPPASQYVAELVQDLDASALITDGVIDASVDSGLGLFETNFNVAEFTTQGAEFLGQFDGQLVFDNGNLAVNLTTPVGNVDTLLDLNTVAGFLGAPIGDIV